MEHKTFLASSSDQILAHLIVEASQQVNSSPKIYVKQEDELFLGFKSEQIPVNVEAIIAAMTPDEKTSLQRLAFSRNIDGLYYHDPRSALALVEEYKRIALHQVLHSSLSGTTYQ